MMYVVVKLDTLNAAGIKLEAINHIMVGEFVFVKFDMTDAMKAFRNIFPSTSTYVIHFPDAEAQNFNALMSQ